MRGEKPSDTRKLAECIQRISQIVTDFEKDIKEFDMNSVVVFEDGKGCRVVDIRIGIRSVASISHPDTLMSSWEEIKHCKMASYPPILQ